MMYAFLIALLAAETAFLFLVYHKLSKSIQTMRQEALQIGNNTIRQIEALMGIYAEVRSNRALPKSRGWAASPDLLAVLLRTVQSHKPMTAFECSSGYSTLILAAAMRNQGDGRVVSLEHDQLYAEKTRKLLETHDLSKWATVILAPLVKVELDGWSGLWYDARAIPEDLTIDMLVVDGPPQSTGRFARYPALPILLKMLNPGAITILDDTKREDETEMVARWLNRFPSLSQLEGENCEKGCVYLKKD